MLTEKTFLCHGGAVFKDGKRVGWYHINKCTGEIKATATLPAANPSLPDNMLIAFGQNELECGEGLEKTFRSMEVSDD